MIITFEQKLRYSDLSTSFIVDLEEEVKNTIRGDKELMDEITEFCKEENADNVEGRLSLKDYIDMKIDEMASDAVEGIRIYCEFDLEVSI